MNNATSVGMLPEHEGVDERDISTPLLFHRPHDDRLHDLPLLHGTFGRRFFHRRRDDVAEAGIAARRAANRVDHRQLARARVVGMRQLFTRGRRSPTDRQ